MRRFNNYDLAGYKPVLAWNPLAMRCTPVNRGCRNCWHLKAADRLAKNPLIGTFARDCYAGKTEPWVASLTGKIPRGGIVCVQFMGDLWHESVDRGLRSWIFDLCEENKENVFVFLTKRPLNVKESFPDNCWIGVSACDQETYEEAVRGLDRIDAKHKWLSLEPLFEDISFGNVVRPDGLEFVAYGPETSGGRETSDSRWMDSLAGLTDLCPDVAFYDKRKNWCVRDWPAEWKACAQCTM